MVVSIVSNGVWMWKYFVEQSLTHSVCLRHELRSTNTFLFCLNPKMHTSLKKQTSTATAYYNISKSTFDILSE